MRIRSTAKILICHNEPVAIYENYSGKESPPLLPDIDLSESEFSREIEIMRASLSRSFARVAILPVDKDIPKACHEIAKASPDLIFNMVESLDGHAGYEFIMAGVFEVMGVPFTGSGALCLGNCLDKAAAKTMLMGSGIKTPRFDVASPGSPYDYDRCPLNFPLVAKPVAEDASIGISEGSVVRDARDLEARVAFLFKHYGQDVLIEEYIEGREINVSILGGKVLSIGEVLFDGLPDHLPRIVTYEAKWNSSSVYFEYSIPKCPADLNETVACDVRVAALASYRAMKCRDYARIDIRLSADNEPYVIDVNPNPDLSTDSGFVREAAGAGLSFDELLLRIATMALERHPLDGDPSREPGVAGSTAIES